MKSTLLSLLFLSLVFVIPFTSASQCTSPTNLTTTNISNSGAVLSWAGAAGSTAYIVQYHAPGGAWINATTQASSLTLTNLTCGTAYEWHVAAFCSNGGTVAGAYSVATSFTTLPCPTNCIAPTSLTNGNVSTTGATLSWAASPGAVAYMVQYHAPGAAWVNVTTQLTSVTLTNLICGTAYEWHVQSICNTTAGGTSPFSVSNTFTTLPCPTQCLPPAGLTTGNISTTGATLSWTPSAGSFAYIVQYHALTSPASPWISTTTQTPSLTLSNLICGTLYEWHVAAFCNNNTTIPGAYSTPISFTTAACTSTCVAPSGLTATNISTTSATLSWTAAAGAIGYAVQYHSANGAWVNVTTQSTSITLTNLTCGTAYEWHGATYCTTTANPPSPYSAIAVFTTLACPVNCIAPQGVVTGNITTTGATLSWTAVPGATSYVVQYHALTPTGSPWITVTTQSPIFTLTNLTCGTIYQWQVATICNTTGGGMSPYTTPLTFTTMPCTTCAAPINPTATSTGTNTAVLTWTAPAGSTLFLVQYHAPGAAWISVTTQSPILTLTNLLCGTQYEWHVAAYCSNSTTVISPYSSTVNFTTAPCVPTCVPPTGLLATNITTTGATISWTAVTGAVGYIAQYHAAGSNTWINVTTQSNTATLTNLTCGTVYEWHVATVCGTAAGSISPYSTSIVFTTPACPVPCNPPATLTTTNISTTGATLSWTPAAGAIAYVVQYHSANGAWTNVTTQSTSITLTNLTCGTVYEWHVATYCNTTANPPGPYSTAISFTTAPCAPTCVPPAGLLATNITTTGATISWTAVTGAVGYIAQYHVAGTNTWINVTSQSNTATLTNLTCGTVYEWHVATVCGTSAGSISPYSTPIIFTTPACPVTCNPPVSLATTNITSTGATLIWAPQPGALAYIVQYHVVPGSTWITVTTQAPSLTLTNLPCGTTYEWHVQALCSTATGSTSPYSISNTFTTLPCTTTCVPPGALTATNISTTGATLSWTAVAGAIGYAVQYHSANGAWINATTQSNSITLTNLTCGTVYEWHVATYCNTTSNPPGPYSAVAVFTTLPCVPTCVPPSGLNATNIGTTGATLSWIAPAGAPGYIVQYHTPGGAWINVNATATSITLTNLTCGTAYEWHVQTLCNTATGSTSPYSVSNTFTTLPCNTTCVAPTALTTGNISTTSATLTWVAPSPAFAYVVQYHAVTSPAAAWINVTTQTNSVTLTNLICGTNYEWHVQTYCGSAATNLSPFSITVHFTTLPCTNVCPVPTGLTSVLLSTTGGGSRMLSWNPTGATSYNIRYRITNTATWLTATSTGNSKLITGLAPLSNYEWQVQSVCSTASGAALVSAWSPSAFFTTPQARSIFPNPASGRAVQLPIVTQNETRFSIIISDRTGRTVRVINKTIAAGGEFLDIDIESLDDGMYFIQVKGGGSNEVQKLFIVR